MRDFFFLRRHTDLDDDIRERAERLKARWDAVVHDRRRITTALGQYRPDTLSSELTQEVLRNQEDHCMTREAELEREDRLLEIDHLQRGLGRINPANPYGPRNREKLLNRIKALEGSSNLLS